MLTVYLTENTDLDREDVLEIEQQAGTFVMHDLQIRPKAVTGQALPVATSNTLGESEKEPISKGYFDLLQQFRALEMENKALKATKTALEKEITEKNILNGDLTAIIADLAINSR